MASVVALRLRMPLPGAETHQYLARPQCCENEASVSGAVLASAGTAIQLASMSDLKNGTAERRLTLGYCVLPAANTCSASVPRVTSTTASSQVLSFASGSSRAWVARKYLPKLRTRLVSVEVSRVAPGLPQLLLVTRTPCAMRSP
ncbi:hypothetical protein D3C72_1453130 [compost metagenome]